MNAIGIIANPFSATDIRRFTNHSSAIGQSEKVRKVLRAINAMDTFGIETVYLMPDSYRLNETIAAAHNCRQDRHLRVELMDYIPSDQPEDTVMAVEMMKAKKIRCLVVFGGDGTNRLVSKCDPEMPVISISTGTNNAFPKFSEETTSGIAAAYLATGRVSANSLRRCKRIEVGINGKFVDIALIDAAIVTVPFVGSKVVDGIDVVKNIIVCKCGPDLIGLSSVIGSVRICEDEDDFGYHTTLDARQVESLAVISSGQIVNVAQSCPEQIPLNHDYTLTPTIKGTLALDGERTVPFSASDVLKFRITRRGPITADVKTILYEATRQTFNSAR